MGRGEYEFSTKAACLQDKGRPRRYAQVFFPNGDIPSLSKNCYLVSLTQNYGKPTSESRKLVNQSRFEMTSDKYTSRERSKREENRIENKRKNGREENSSEQKKTEQTRKENKYRGENVKGE